MKNAISPEQIVLTALHDFAAAAVDAWKKNDENAMSAAVTRAHDSITRRMRGADRLYSALFRIVREDSALGESQGMKIRMGPFAAIADAALREYEADTRA
jgi:hypothetical protein